ncbi:TetR/AcrR family transcriptional regulator [Nocardia asteroides]|uniref:TetR/AcrR family transcriptional regulator n=1 Tax=Nocardia asteroides TaxID=1824 RepID=UPI001E64E781|nr:TetR/AcrR family transcriptional regulator [Nocardia asteroides]UGT55944.1 TetR/AcrR family transcriptional regulator [Nocardia asteroides]
MTSARGSAARHAASPPDLDPSADIASLARVFDMDVMRERILAAAIAIVSDRGFGACTVREVAEAVGIKAPGLYSHFTSKEAILTEAVSRVLTDFMDVAATVTGADPEEELRETVRRHVLYQIDNMQIARVADLFLNTGTAGHFLSADEYDRLHSEQRVYIDLVSERVAAFAPRLPAAEVPVVSIAIIAMCDHVANWFRAGDTLEPDELAELHWQLARSMITGRATKAGTA